MPIQVSQSVIAASMPTHARLVWFWLTVKCNIRARRVSSPQAYRWNRCGNAELFEIWSLIQPQTKRSCGLLFRIAPQVVTKLVTVIVHTRGGLLTPNAVQATPHFQTQLLQIIQGQMPIADGRVRHVHHFGILQQGLILARRLFIADIQT